MNPELFWLKDVIVLLISSLIAFLISYGIKETFGKDYSALVTYGIVLAISFVPLIIVLFFGSNFNTEFYNKYLNFSQRYLIDCIVGATFHPIWERLT